MTTHKQARLAGAPSHTTKTGAKPHTPAGERPEAPRQQQAAAPAPRPRLGEVSDGRR